jgi:hypothetical protein
VSQPETINPVKLFMGYIYNDESKLSEMKDKLIQMFGPIDYESRIFDFSTPTKYYEKDMGENLKKRFLSFKNLVDPMELVRAKVETDNLEQYFLKNETRTINIDAGYIDFNKVVLASYKYGSHKIYIGGKVYADLTLLYNKGSFTNFRWTFPDFRDEKYYKTLMEIRQLMKNELKD